jgi:hypothetical protein
LFFRGDKAGVIAELLNAELKTALTRESIYPLLAKARDRGFIRLVPPLEDALAKDVIMTFGLKPETVRVVYTENERSNELVAMEAADLTLRLVKAVGIKAKVPVGLGLAAILFT